MYGSTLFPQQREEERGGGEEVAAALGATPISTRAVSLSTADVGPHEHTNSINRSYSDLDTTRFLLYAAALCGLRTALQQPLNLALARKQTCSAASSMTMLRIVRLVYHTEGGLRGISRGMTALTLGCALSEALYLWLFEYSRERLPLDSDTSRDAISGYVSDATCRLIHLPLSIVALRQMTAKNVMGNGTRDAHNMLHTFLTMYREGGIRSVFAGYSTTLLVGCQWTALWWALYGRSKSYLYTAADGLLEEQHDGSSSCTWRHWALAKDDNVILNSAASIFTSASTAVLFNPYLVVRANLQVTPNARLWRVGRDLYRSRGLRGFYGGLALTVGTCLIDGVLASTSYEYAKLWADKTHIHA